MTDIIDELRKHRSEAFTAQDSNAPVCFLATTDPHGQPQVRTLVLREINDTDLTLFINASSPKWEQLQSNPQCQVLLWYATLNLQYRITGIAEALPASAITNNWHKRPHRAKVLDYFYDTVAPQSATMASRDALLESFEAINRTRAPGEMRPSVAALAIRVQLARIERLDLTEDGLPHIRQQFDLSDTGWSETTLVP
ncbi:MAG: pyridoxamine 5'-phosphate oxidase family protein [Pseudomonadales bacterium]